MHIHDTGRHCDAHVITQATEGENNAEIRAGHPELGGKVRDGHPQGGGNGPTSELGEIIREGEAYSREVIGGDNTACSVYPLLYIVKTCTIVVGRRLPAAFGAVRGILRVMQN